MKLFIEVLFFVHCCTTRIMFSLRQYVILRNQTIMHLQLAFEQSTCAHGQEGFQLVRIHLLTNQENGAVQKNGTV